MLSGKRALVTGSSSGIGLAVAQAYLTAGARVVLTSEREEPHLPADVIESENAAYFPVDLAEEAAAEFLVSAAWDWLDGVDILVNNVGTFSEPAFLELTRSDFDSTFGVNVWPAIAVTQAVVRRGRDTGRGGRILFTSSLNATRSEPGHTLYDASKAAIDALTRQLAIELAPWGYTTAAVAPGLVETPITDFGLRSDPAARAAVTAQIPLRRIATVDEIAPWFVFLASDAASYATGSIINVDGGLDAQQMALRPMTIGERK